MGAIASVTDAAESGVPSCAGSGKVRLELLQLLQEAACGYIENAVLAQDQRGVSGHSIELTGKNFDFPLCALGRWWRPGCGTKPDLAKRPFGSDFKPVQFGVVIIRVPRSLQSDRGVF